MQFPQIPVVRAPLSGPAGAWCCVGVRDRLEVPFDAGGLPPDQREEISAIYERELAQLLRGGG